MWGQGAEVPVNSVSGTRLGGCPQQCLPEDASLEVPLPLAMQIQETSGTGHMQNGVAHLSIA
jgi:hypothetical protein